MRLGLCSGASPEASLDELLQAAGRRGFAVVELRDGDAHGVDSVGPPPAVAARAVAEGVEIAGYRVTAPTEPRRLARIAAQIAAPILYDGAVGVGERLEFALRLASEGVPTGFVIRSGETTADVRAAHDAGLDLAWEADPRDGPLGPGVARLLDEFGDGLRHIRLHGGGPEAGLQEGQGVGEMTARLALAGYQGTVVVTPSSPRYHIAWQSWLGRRGGWGCGSKAADPTLVTLATTTAEREVAR